MRTRCAALVIAGIVGCLAAPAHADPRADIIAKTRAAMASYDALDLEAARRLLNQALAIAKKAKLDKDPIVARVYLDLGIAQLAGADQEAAKVAFLSAALIDPKITVDAAYRSPEVVKLLDEAKAAAVDSGSEPGEVDCKSVRGLQHTIIDSARPGAAQPIEVLIGSDLAAARVVAMYRPEGAIDFTEARLSRQGGCRYAGTIPAAAMRGSVVHYYIAAYDANNKVLAAKGSSGTPNIMELGPSGGSGPATETEEPGGPPRGKSSAEISAEASRPSHKLMLGVAAGTGFGYVTGRTEDGNVVQKCCIGSSLLVLAAEFGYHANRKTSIGVAARFGFPIGANISGHSSLAPAAFLRVRYALSGPGNGFRVMAEVGGGVLRNTIKLDATQAGMDVDVVAQGPLLLGAGIGYSYRVGDTMALLVDVDAIAGLAVVTKVGSAVHLNSGISADVRAGLAIGF